MDAIPSTGRSRHKKERKRRRDSPEVEWVEVKRETKTVESATEVVKNNSSAPVKRDDWMTVGFVESFKPEIKDEDAKVSYN